MAECRYKYATQWTHSPCSASLINRTLHAVLCIGSLIFVLLTAS